MATIRAIESRSIHQIQSGQVIVDLCSVVKELVENSLDAGATSIEVRFKNQGLDTIEVQDNGNSISSQNYETVALKHYTSKLSTYADLSTLQTFGFRGEALSSLCALSQFTIIACQESDAPKGTRLEFEVSGRLKATSVVAAQKGTTVIVENLFNNLPVRRRELERNIKREWNRVVSLLGQYACIQTGVKISITQQQAKGKKITVFSTKGNLSTRENIVNIFGAKTISTLLPLDLDLEFEATHTGIGQHRNISENDETKKISVTGFISRPAFGEGRQTPDRQMFFVNARPCALPQVAKAFNEVYKSYNNSQSPFIFINFEMDTHNYDVNVSPNKRTILLHDQTRMLEQLKVSLIKLFESEDYTLPVSQVFTPKLPSYKQLTISKNVEEITQGQSPKSRISKDFRSLPVNQAKVVPTNEEEGSSGSAPSSSQESGDFSSRDREALNLMSSWLGKTTTVRERRESKSSDAPGNIAKGATKEKLRPATKLSEEEQLSDQEREASEDGSTNIANNSPSPSTESQHAIVAEAKGWDQSIVIGDQYTYEQPITALNSPSQRQRLEPKVNATGASSARIRRQPETATTITIGGRTITNPIDSPPLKKARLHGPVQSSQLPTFGRLLNRRFAPQPDDRGSDAAEDESQGDVASSLSSKENDSSSLNDNSDIKKKDRQDAELELSDTDDKSSPVPGDNEADEDYIDDVEKKAQEDAKVEEMIRAAEKEASRPSDENLKRAHLLLKGGSRKKDATVHLLRTLNTSVDGIKRKVKLLTESFESFKNHDGRSEEHDSDLNSANPEERLSLTINKTDFNDMHIVGQFNLGFILASRVSRGSDDLFIIDQHASDEKYNFERLQATTIVQSQRLVRPKTLDLTALEEEIVKENLSALTNNGFVVTVDESGDSPVGQRCQLVSLPLSRETTFSVSDLEELISLLSDHPTGFNTPPPRPSKVRKMFAMRACRSSIMIGRTLTKKQMERVVSHMGELDKPWNCPHGRPTMRHLCGLNIWDEVGWKEGDGMDTKQEQERLEPDWAGYVRQMHHESA